MTAAFGGEMALSARGARAPNHGGMTAHVSIRALSFTVIAVAFATGCSDGNQVTGPSGSRVGGSGGAGGSAASGGTGGTGGTGGSAGSAASAGASAGGTGGTTGGSAGVGTGGASAGGTGGSSGTAGSGGTSGASGGAGTGASGGTLAGASGSSGTAGGAGGSGGGAGATGGKGGNGGGGGNAGAMGGAGSGGAASGGKGGSGGSAGGSACSKGQVAPDEVAFIGDSWIELPGSQTRHLYELARAAGVLPQGETYDDRSVSGSPLANIIGQYRDNRNIKVLIMDGGGIDLFNGGTQAQVDAVVTRFEDFLDEVATDGNVEHIIYYLYPAIPGVPGKLSQIMKPGMPNACAASTVPCHFVELAPLFAGKPELIGGDTIHPSEAGGNVIAEAVWKVMQDNCIAQ